MSAIKDLHNKAMTSAEKGFLAELQGNYVTADAHFETAFKLERQAATKLAPNVDAEPSRSILLRSAASLALKCSQHREAEQLIATALSGSPPPEICEELRNVLETVYFERHLSLRGMRLDPAEVQMSLNGAAVGHGIVESHQFMRRADVVEKMLMRTSELLRNLPFRETGAPNQRAMEGFEVFFSVPRAASFAITIRVGRPIYQPILEGLGIGPKDVVDDFLLSLKEYNAGESIKLSERISTQAYLNNFKALARKLAPDGTKVRAVGFTSYRGKQEHTVFLDKPPSQVWDAVTNTQGTITLKGIFKLADETKHRGNQPLFGIEDDRGKTTTVIVPPGMLQDIVKPLWGQLVTVVARRKRRRYEMLTIDSVQEPSS